MLGVLPSVLGRGFLLPADAGQQLCRDPLHGDLRTRQIQHQLWVTWQSVLQSVWQSVLQSVRQSVTTFWHPVTQPQSGRFIQFRTKWCKAGAVIYLLTPTRRHYSHLSPESSYLDKLPSPPLPSPPPPLISKRYFLSFPAGHLTCWVTDLYFPFSSSSKLCHFSHSIFWHI